MLDSDFDDDNSVQFTAGSVIYNFDEESDCAYFLKKGVEIISKKGTTVGFINEEEVLVNNQYYLIQKELLQQRLLKTA